MSTESDAMDAWARSLGLKEDMAARVVGDDPLVVAAHPIEGEIYIGEINAGRVVLVAEVTAVQCAELIRRLTTAKYIVESGVGSMR